MSTSSLEGRVAVVTGASSGIGKACAILLAEAGCKGVVITARHEDKLTEVKEEIGRRCPNNKCEVLTVACDVSKAEDVKTLFDRTKEKFGQVDVLVPNAGINGTWAPIEEMEVEEFDQVINTNLRGTWLTIKFGVPLMKHQTRYTKSIVIMSSINGTRVFLNTGATPYASSKAGQVAMCKMLAIELAKYRIRVNAICPGAIETAINDKTELRHLEHIRLRAEFPEGVIPLTGKKPGSAEQVGKLVKFIASDDADHISGTEIFIDGAESLFAL